MDNQMLLVMCSFGAVALIGFFASKLMMGSDDDEKLRGRLSNRIDTISSSGGSAVAGSTMVPLLQRIGQAAAEPFMPKTREKQSALRRTLGYAGIYSPSALKIITGAKVIFLAVGLLGGYLIGMAYDSPIMGLSLGGIFGYLAPAVWLKYAVKKNQGALNLGLPDALDLMVICVEAGLTVDAAMQRVGSEMSIAHPTVSRELGIAHMETRVGLSRSESLRNLGTRTGNASLQSLAAMLIQAERFGTSIGSALRIHAESLRLARQHAAEEMGAKASVKMSFPLVLFIFPATFLILAGPTIINLMNSSFMKD